MSRNKSISFTDVSDEQPMIKTQESIQDRDADEDDHVLVGEIEIDEYEPEVEPEGETIEELSVKQKKALDKEKAAIEKKERAAQARALRVASKTSNQWRGKRTTMAVVKNVSLIALSVGATYAMQMYVIPIQPNHAEQQALLDELAEITTQQGLSISDLTENLKIAKKQVMTNSEQVQDLDVSQKNFETRIKDYIKEQQVLDEEYRTLVETLKQTSKDDSNKIELASARIAVIKDTVDTNSQEILEHAKALRELIQKAKQRANEQTNQVIDNVKESSSNEARGDSSKKSKAQQVTTINGLQVEDVISYGGQTLAVLTDGLSATVPIAEGDMIGNAEITKITPDVVGFTDRVTGTHYEIQVN
jgi:hypothetical protein